jgi:acyl-CoA thioesterase
VVTMQGMLVELLDLERVEVDIFRGRSPDENLQRVFGGQALVAAGRTVPPDRLVHSLHAYFIRPRDPDLQIVGTVDRIRDGRSFTTAGWWRSRTDAISLRSRPRFRWPRRARTISR